MLTLTLLQECMINIASSLDTVNKDDLKLAYKCIDAPYQSRKPTKRQMEAYERVENAVYKNPRTKLEILTLHRDAIRIHMDVDKNASLYGISTRIFTEYQTKEFDLKEFVEKEDKRILYGNINEYAEWENNGTFNLETDASIGKLVSEKDRFLLYGTFRDYQYPGKVSGHMEAAINGKWKYPIDKIQMPETERQVQLPLDNRYIPSIIFVGNINNSCKDALVYLHEKFYDYEDIHPVVEYIAPMFVREKIRNNNTIENEEALRNMEKEIEELEKNEDYSEPNK